MSGEERSRLAQTEPSNRWIDPAFHPLAADYQATLQRYEDHLTYDSGMSFNEFTTIQGDLSRAEDDAIQQARVAMLLAQKPLTKQEVQSLVADLTHQSKNAESQAFIAPRSGLALHHGIDVVQPGDRIAQIIFEEVAYPRMVQKDARNLRDIRNLREKY